MEDSLLETVLAKDPSSKEDPAFLPMPSDSKPGLHVWFYDFVTKRNIVNEINEWNLEYNVDKRAGVLRYRSLGPYLHLWFQATDANQGYEDLRKELLTDKVIARLEAKYDNIA